jgi:hypothetical protein
MRPATFFTAIALITLLFPACKETGNSMKPNINGSMGELLLVMDDKWKTTESGQNLIDILTQPMQGLPQVETLFNLSVVPHRSFTNHMKVFRNLIITTISPSVETEGVKYFTHNAWASEQALMRIEAKTPERFAEIIQENEVRILGFFVRAERQRSLRYYTKYIDAGLTDSVNKKFNINMVVPNNCKGNKGDDTFTWFSNETELTSQGVFVYAFDYVGEGTLSLEYLLNKRDSTLRLNVPGPLTGTYMATEYELPITYKTLKVNGHDAVELRGLWKIMGYPMGGPFVMFAHRDSVNNRIVVTDGYVYSPEKPNKRNLVWQVESILYSLKFPSDKEEALKQ